MPTWQESADLTAIEQNQYQLTAEQRLSGELAGLLRDLEAKENAVKEILELTKYRPECVGDYRRATEKLAKFSSQRAALERRISDNKSRIGVFSERIARARKGMDPGNLERAGRIRHLFAGLGQST